MALAEVLVSASVLLIMLALATLAMVGYMRATRQLSDRAYSSDAMARGLERSTRLLRSAQEVVAPSREALAASYRPQVPDQAPLVLKVRTAQGSRTVGLAWNPAKNRLVQLAYPAAYDPTQPYPAAAPVTELGPARGLTVCLTSKGQLQLRLEGDPTQLPWGTALDFEGVPVP